MEFINVETVAGVETECVYDFESFPWQYYLFGCKESKKRDNDLNQNIHYLEIPCAFDIETTNITEDLNYQLTDDFYDHLKKLQLKVPRPMARSIADYSEIRKNHSRNLYYNKGVPVDTAYQELQELRPDLFPEILHPVDQLLRILDVMDRMRPGDEFRPYSFMYHWQFCMGKFVLFGRTWQEFQKLLRRLSDELHLSDERRLVIYCHNLSFEFEHFRKFVFVRHGFFKEERKPLYVLVSGGIEFRDSYALSNMSLAKFCENEGAKHYKLVDTYDYAKIRTQRTRLTEEEKAYCYNDVAGLSECIASRMKENTLANIPLTSTGYVRRDFRNAMRTNKENRDKFLVSQLDEKLYKMMRAAFRGGDTHANAIHANQVLTDVYSYDIASSYPAAMVTGDYPIGPFSRISHRRFMARDTREKYCHILRICLEHPCYVGSCGIPYISMSKIENKIEIGDRIADNGRLLWTRAGVKVLLTVTDIDFDIIVNEYKFDNLFISDVYGALKGKLSPEFRSQVLSYFQKKTALKNDPSHEYEYNKSKARINAAYGMMVMRIDMPVTVYDQTTGEYRTEELPLQETLKKYYKSRNNFLSYQHGVWVTALARQKLRKMLNIVGRDVVYCDTDSVKFINRRHCDEFEKENESLRQLAIDSGAVATDKNGQDHYLGVWEYEGKYEEFKTLGAKKYIVKKDGYYHSTIAGVSKRAGHEFFNKHGIQAFKNGTVIDNSGHLVAFYNDEDIHKIKVNNVEMISGSNIALVDSTYTIGVTGEYMDVLKKALAKNYDVEYY